MKTKLFKTSFAFFFLLLFAGSKAYGYHAFFHDHDTMIIECEVCDKALLDQFSPLDFSDHHVDITEIQKDFRDSIINGYVSEFYPKQQFSVLFGRPPPINN
ncbi:hypothetical protein [Pseudotenacibaculum haliotis]|uniref:Uncharacterized protein n=1 Tax=Pseudotenacibaculum haliotis TaxID=1862138 RepID=A0ABW5LV94_9FLAO